MRRVALARPFPLGLSSSSSSSAAAAATTTATTTTTPSIVPRHILFYDYVDDILEKRDPLRGDHLNLVSEFVKQGDIVMGGAYADPVDGACIVFADSAGPQKFVERDPYVKGGLVTKWFTREWSTVEFS